MGLLEILGLKKKDNQQQPNNPVTAFNQFSRAIQPIGQRLQAQQLINKTSSEQGYTPGFLNTLNKSDNRYTNVPDEGQDSLNGGRAAGTFHPDDHKIVVNRNPNDLINDRNTLTHEGLHAAWENNQGSQKEFANAYNQQANPDLKDFLTGRLSGYKNFKGQDSLSDFNKLSPDIQTEVHSFVPEYYKNINRYNIAPLNNNVPQGFNQYYGRYFDVNNLKNVGEQQYKDQKVQSRLNFTPIAGRLKRLLGAD